MWCRWAVVLALSASLTAAFNLAPNYAILVHDPSGGNTEPSYFGYSVSLVTGDDASWVVVGAPRANSTAHAELVEPGVTYLCSLGAERLCNPVTLDTSGNVVTTAGASKTKHKKDHAWIGGAVDVFHDSEGTRLLVCGPRWKNQLYANEYLMNGICYLKHYPFDTPDNAEPLMFLVSSDKQATQSKVGNVTSRIFFYAYGEAGLAAHFTQNGEILIGAPGVKLWAGTIVRYRSVVAGDDEEVLAKSGFREEVCIPNPLNTPQLTDFAYFGYSLASGRFIKARKDLYYVGGAPRAGTLKGKVFVFNFPTTDDAELHILAELDGFQMGEYFGASVCAVDLNGDGLDDLVVGAPHYSLAVEGSAGVTGDEGRIYVFVNEDMGILRDVTDKTIISGSKMLGARFGTTISHVGDINKDGFEDIAVGAPYEDSGRGAVYIYHGCNTGLNVKYSQRIRAAEIHTSLSGFGISISRGLDIDNNFYNDIAVGAYDSGHAVVIPSRPVITFRGRVYSHVTELPLNATGFTSFACLSYTGQHAPHQVDALVTLTSMSTDGKTLLGVKDHTNRSYSYRTSLTDSLEKCSDFQVLLLNEIKDYTKPVEIQMHYKLEKTALHRRRRKSVMEPYEFCKDCPVVNPSENTFISWKLPYAFECGEDNKCSADLAVAAEFLDITPPLVLGTRSKLGMRVLVSNHGVQAFLVKLNVSIPREITLSRLPSTCQEISGSKDTKSTHLECDMDTVMAAGTKKELLLEFYVGVLRSKTDSLEFGFNVKSAGEEVSPENNFFGISLPIQILADVGIEGKSSQDHGTIANGNQTFFHTFEVMNNGPSPVNMLRLEFRIPVFVKTEKAVIKFIQVYKPVAYFGNQPITCSAVRGSFASELEKPSHELEGSVEGHTISRRSIDNSSIIDSESDLPANRTLLVLCSNPIVDCLTVQCDAGPFFSKNNRADIRFKLSADFDKIEPILNKRDIIVISSVGRVWITNLPHAKQPVNGKSDISAVNSVFFGNLPEQGIDSWVLAFSISLGLLIFLFMVLGLVKIGFFRRRVSEDRVLLTQSSRSRADSNNRRRSSSRN